MNILRKDIDQNNATLTLQIEKADYAEKVEKTLREYRKKANIPGFRPGMVPAGLVKKMYGKAITAEEINKMISDELYKYIRDNNIAMLGEPLPNDAEQKDIDFNSEETLEFVFDLGIAPEFEVELTKKDKIDFYQITVSDEMIENQVKSHTGRYGKYIQEDTAEEKDMLKGHVVELADGVAKEGGLTVSDAVLTPAYLKDEASKAKFVGAKKGDTIVFNPAKALEEATEISSFLKVSKEDAAEITADFSFVIEGITRYHEAEINQELFDKVFGENTVTNEEEFKNRIKANIEETLQADSDYKFGIDAREVILSKFEDLTFPDAFLKRWVKATNENLTDEALEADYPKMIEDLKWQLIKDKIAKTQDFKIENTDVEAYAQKITRAQFAQYGMIGLDTEIIENYAKDMLKKEDTLKSIIDKVAEEKVFEAVKGIVTLKTKEVSVEEFNKMFEN